MSSGIDRSVCSGSNRFEQSTQTDVSISGPYNLISFLGLLGLLGMSPTVLAQTTGQSVKLEEIVVTGRKREEILQDVPVSITVVDGTFIEDSGIKNLESLSAQIPTFQYSESVSGNDQVFIRGVGSGVNFGFENTVGQVFDGFFMGRARFGRASFMDIEQIEVLKGPQGAIVGKNTSAGVVNTRWAKPTEEFSAHIIGTLTYEGDEGYAVQGAVSGPLSEKVRGRMAFRLDDTDGYFKNATVEDTQMQSESLSLRTTLDYDISENLFARLVYQYNEQERLGRPFDTGNCPPDVVQAYALLGDDCTVNYRNTGSIVQMGETIPQTTDTKAHFAGLTVDWDVGSGTLSSLTGFARFETDDYTGGSIGGLEGNVSNFRETYQQVTQEFRFASSPSDSFDYIFGTYIQYVTNQDLDWNLDLNAQGPSPFSFVPPPARLRSNRDASQDSKSIALFGEVTQDLTSTVDLTGSLRFTYEEKDIEKTQSPSIIFTEIPTAPAPFGPPPVVNVHDVRDSLSENQWTPAVSLRWRPMDGRMYYASVSTGFKGGGFDFFTADPQETVLQNLQFGDEKVIAYEVGAKYVFPEISLSLNIAAFHNKFDDLQVTSLTVNPDTDTIAFATENAAAAITQGVEADFTWQPIQAFSLTGAVAYLDAYYDEFNSAPCYLGQTIAQGCVESVGTGTQVQDLSNQSLQYAPEWKGSITGRYSVAVAENLTLQFLGTLTYSSEFALQVDLDPVHFQDDYTKFDASVALERNDGSWRLALVGRNLTDKLTVNFGNDAGSGTSFFNVEPPRTLAIQGSIRF